MAIRSREGGDKTGRRVEGFPYPYNTDLHWLWGWGQRVESWYYKEPFEPGESDWMVTRACGHANDAMMRFSIDYPAVVEEIKRGQRDVESRWEEALNNPKDEYMAGYAESLRILSHRIFKACELIADREPPVFVGEPNSDNSLGPVRTDAHAKKLFPHGLPPDQDTVDAVVKLDTERSADNTDIGILRSFTGEKPGADKKAKSLQGKIRALRGRGGTTLPART